MIIKSLYEAIKCFGDIQRQRETMDALYASLNPLTDAAYVNSTTTNNTTTTNSDLTLMQHNTNMNFSIAAGSSIENGKTLTKRTLSDVRRSDCNNV